MRVVAFLLCAAAAAACGATTTTGSTPGDSGNGDSGHAPVATCAQPVAAACDPAVRPCVTHWPSDLSAYCPGDATLAHFASVSHVAQRCGGYDVVTTPAGVDTALLYLYAQDGTLAAIVQMGESGYHCLGGPTPLGFPGLCSANPATDTPHCCAPAPEEVVPCWTPDAGAGD